MIVYIESMWKQQGLCLRDPRGVRKIRYFSCRLACQ